ncbi:MAG: hypothetical protein EBY47_02130 [Actinobacteria bacterium]|nr:hypothetical protein [Actinomycetota bacterium]
MTTSPPEPNGDEFPDVPDFIDEDEFLTAAPKEGTADERAAQAARIAQGNDGSGKPVYRRSAKVVPWIGMGTAIAVLVVVVVLLAR